MSLFVGHPAAALLGFGLVGLGIANLIPILFSAAGRSQGVPPGTALAAVATTGYLGYLYWDIILRPTASALSLDAGPIDEILIDRISPEDSTTLGLHDQKSVLQGGSFAGFGGFLSRSIRENDYLWGRLHAVDRLFDILDGTVPANRRGDFDIAALKKRAFGKGLEEEA